MQKKGIVDEIKLNKILIFFYYSMFNIFILTIFIYIIYRIFSKIFDRIEDLAAFLFKTSQKTNNSQSADTKSKQTKSIVATSFIREIPKQKELSVNSSSNNTIKRQKFPLTVVQQKPHQQANSEIIPTQNEARQQVSLKQQIQGYCPTIQRMQEEIEQQKQQKPSFVNKIQENIQHVIQQQQKPPQVPSQDQEMRALSEVTKGIQFAHQVQQLKDNMKQQQTAFHQKYLADIQQLQAKLSSKDQQIATLKQQISYNQQERQSQKPKHEKNDVEKQIVGNEQQILSLKTEKQVAQAFLKTMGEEKSSIQAQLHRYQAIVNDFQLKRIEMAQELEDNQTYIATLNQENQQLADNLRSTMNELQLCKQKLRKLNNNSTVGQIDKLQSDFKLQAYLRSLKEAKADLQNQVRQLNEALENQQRDRQLQIESELVRRNQAEIEGLRKIIGKEQQEKAEAQKKILEIQSELQFARMQLKNTAQSQKRLSQQIKALKTPKKQASSNISGVRVSTESAKINKKVEQPQEMKGEQEDQTVQLKLVPDKKINYVRTKLQRQASPTFQYDSKEKSKQKNVSSVIFSGVFDKIKSPIDLRYNTPVQKTIAQSSIYQGTTSEGYFGQTNILNQQQRQFVLNQISHMKKISAKKTRLLYRSLNNNSNKPISQHVCNVPNLLVVVELTNKKILGAFTQAAFNKDLNNQTQRKYVSNNKAFLIDITQQIVVLNSSNSQTIRYDQMALIWGRNEFSINSEEPLLLTCDLNCQGAVFPSKLSTQQWCGTSGSAPVSQFQVYRIFLG